MAPLDVALDGRDRDRRRDDGGRERRPRRAPAAEQQPQRHDRHQREPGAAVPDAEPGAEAGEERPAPAAAPGADGRIEHRRQQEDVGRLAERGMLDQELVARERERRRRHHAEPARAADRAHGQVDEDRRGESERVLHDRHEEQVRAEPVQRGEQHAVADGAQRVAPDAFVGVLEVDAAVGVAGDRRVPDERQPDARGEAEQQNRRERGEVRPATRGRGEARLRGAAAGLTARARS